MLGEIARDSRMVV